MHLRSYNSFVTGALLMTMMTMIEVPFKLYFPVTPGYWKLQRPHLLTILYHHPYRWRSL